MGSNRYCGAEEVALPEKREESNGRTKRRIRGKSCRNVALKEGVGSDCASASRGRLRGRAPPN